MSASLRAAWTQEQFFAWQGDGDTRYEFDGTEPMAMVGNTVAHGIIMRNLHRCLDRGLDGSGFQYLGPDNGVATTGQAVRYPDALVTAASLGMAAPIVPDVIAVFEIVSPSSGGTDRIVKVREYAGVPSIRRYAIIESTTAGVTVFERPDGTSGWRADTLTGSDVLRMPELELTIAVAELYRDVVLASGPAA